MSASNFRRLDDAFSVAPQLVEQDFVQAREQGFRTIINNRPDGEGSGQMSSDRAEAAASAHGLKYIYLPVISGGMTAADVVAMREALASAERPVLAYCRTGTRSCNLWALASAPDVAADQLVDLAARAGYDLAPLSGQLVAIHHRGGL
ncbi:MAG: TIGR01244 family sulfur transferase [Geminicoccaceae bacterium]